MYLQVFLILELRFGGWWRVWVAGVYMGFVLFRCTCWDIEQKL